MIIDFEHEKLKRSDYHDLCIDLLEEFLDDFLTSDKESREGLITEFIEDLDLGPKPISCFVRAYFSDSNIQFALDNILTRVPLSALSNVVEFIEVCWPQEQTLVKRMKVLLIGFGIKKIKLQSSPVFMESVERYFSGKSNALEDEILSPTLNVLQFPASFHHHYGSAPAKSV